MLCLKKNIMKKLLVYFFNIFLFVILWGIKSVVIINFTVQYISVNPLVPIAVGVIIVLFTSYKLVKKFNKSNIWAILFDDKININSDKTTTINAMD